MPPPRTGPRRECDVSFSLEDIEKGDIHIIFGHPESLSSAKRSKILTHLLRNQLLLGVICDEFHKPEGKGKAFCDNLRILCDKVS